MLLRHIGRRSCAMARFLAAVSMEVNSCCSTTPMWPWACEDQHLVSRRQPAARLLIAKPFIGAPMLHQNACAAIQKYHERKLFGYTPQQMHEVVANVEQYKEFVPWCVSSTVLREGSDSIDAELEIGFHVFVERYTSRVTVRQPHLIEAVAEDSTLFDSLENTWEFKPGPIRNSCWVSFTVGFAFKSEVYAQVATVFFEQVVQKTISAFEHRCEQLYGPSSLKRKRP